MLIAMAVEAKCVCHGLAEVRGFVTLRAPQPIVLALKRELRPRMIEGRREPDGLPTCRVVARLTGAVERTVMGVFVTRGAGLEVSKLELHGGVRTS